jgi:hypothetical protein
VTLRAGLQRAWNGQPGAADAVESAARQARLLVAQLRHTVAAWRAGLLWIDTAAPLTTLRNDADTVADQLDRLLGQFDAAADDARRESVASDELPDRIVRTLHVVASNLRDAGKDTRAWAKRLSVRLDLTRLVAGEALLPADRTAMEGFAVAVLGYSPADGDGIGWARALLRQFRASAERHAPVLLRDPPVIVLDFARDDGHCGRYYGWEHEDAAKYGWKHRTPVPHPRVHLSIRTLRGWARAATNVRDGVQCLAHELGHHLWRSFLTPDARELWQQLVGEKRIRLDLDRVAAVLREAPTVDTDAWLKANHPVLWLQISISCTEWKDGKSGWRKGDTLCPLNLPRVEALRQRGKRYVMAPELPVTWYGAKSGEEAWCEALGQHVGFGPMAVHPVVREVLAVLLPRFHKRNPAHGAPTLA